METKTNTKEANSLGQCELKTIKSSAQISSFPKYFPPNCPPKNCKPTQSGEKVFRAVVDPITTKDVQTNYEEDNKSGEISCERMSISFFTSKDRVKDMIRSYQKFHGKKIASIILESRWGEINKGKSKGKAGAHIHLWPYSQTSRQNIVNKFVLEK